jgi:hypothetical protein
VRAEWSGHKGIEDIVKVLELTLTRDDMKFCKRVGKTRQVPRALMVSFYAEYARSTLLRYIYYLAGTEYEHVSIMPEETETGRGQYEEGGRKEK